MFVIIAGGGRTGSHLAALLLGQGHEVRLIENRTSTLSTLHRELPTEAVFEGDPTDPQTLAEAGIERANVIAAVTSIDEDNLVIASLARFHYSVRRIIGRVNNPRNAWLFTPEFGVDVALNQADVMAKLIEEEMSLGDMMTLLKLRRGEYSLVEEKVDPQAAAAGKRVAELPLPEECVLTAILRGGRLLLPKGDTVLQPADEVLAVVASDQADQLAGILSASRQR